MLENRRKYSRVPMKAQVTCIIDSRTMRGVSWNLGEGGMQVEVSGLQPKEAVQLSFRLPASGLAIDAVGVVIWGDEKRHGIRFTYIGAQSQQSIHEYITERSGAAVE
jgi:c-di-GMP-binding flagellar brake protein YcgR